jgi:hypothetical protein
MGSPRLLQITEKKASHSSNRRVARGLKLEKLMTTPDTCERKVPFESKAHALNARQHMSDSGLHPYKCPYGNHWHLGRHRGEW